MGVGHSYTSLGLVALAWPLAIYAALTSSLQLCLRRKAFFSLAMLCVLLVPALGFQKPRGFSAIPH